MRYGSSSNQDKFTSHCSFKLLALTLFRFSFRKSYYGLAIVGNKNLLSITWNKQDELFLYERIDVRFAVHNNMLLCEKKIDWLEKQFSYAVDQGDNGLIAVCKYCSKT